MQSTSHTYEAVNVGRSNEVSAEVQALDRARRKVLLKAREGYVELVNGRLLEASPDSIQPNQPLPINLRFLKPDNTPSAAMRKKMRRGEALFTRKRDGMMHVIRFTEDDVEIYSRTMLRALDKEPEKDWAERYQQLYEDCVMLLTDRIVPPHSILLGELVPNSADDDFKLVESVTKSLTVKALETQEREGHLAFYVWDVAFWAGEAVISSETAEARQACIRESFDGSSLVLPTEVWTPKQVWEAATKLTFVFDGLDTHFHRGLSRYPVAIYTSKAGRQFEVTLDLMAEHLAKQFQWEGWVVVDPKGVYGDNAFNFRGKTDRPGKYLCKLKPLYEDDFVALWDPSQGEGTYGNGKNQGLVGSLALYQFTKKDDLVYICEVGGGIRDKYSSDYPDGPLRADLSKPGTYPRVVRVAYDSRTYKSMGAETNALRFPRILSFRTDKDMEECINPRL